LEAEIFTPSGTKPTPVVVIKSLSANPVDHFGIARTTATPAASPQTTSIQSLARVLHGQALSRRRLPTDKAVAPAHRQVVYRAVDRQFSNVPAGTPVASPRKSRWSWRSVRLPLEHRLIVKLAQNFVVKRGKKKIAYELCRQPSAATVS